MPIFKKFNKDFFKRWSSDMGYILGFLFADGNITKTNRNTYFTAFYTADHDLLFSIRKSIGSNHKISKKESKTGIVYILQIGSKELFNDLGMLGLIPNKARRMKLPKIPKKYAGDFVRGYFDGDGCVWTGKIHKERKKQTLGIVISFTSASFDFLSELKLLLKNEGLIGGSLFRSRRGNYARLQYSTLNALKLYKIMYNRRCNLFLDRKRVIFEDFVKMRP
jgi:intein-encoded DNA endonuclease-like protein